MKIGLFIPCYVDAVYPQVGVATYKLLKHLDLDVTYPQGQTCCGQPMANAGFEQQAVPLAEKFEDLFHDFDYVVTPSVSCTAFIRLNYPRLLHHECLTAKKAMDVVEFLHDVVKVERRLGTFPTRSACTIPVMVYANWGSRALPNSMLKSSTKSRTCCSWSMVLMWSSQSALTNAVVLVACFLSKRLPSQHKWDATRWNGTSRREQNT